MIIADGGKGDVRDGDVEVNIHWCGGVVWWNVWLWVHKNFVYVSLAGGS